MNFSLHLWIGCYCDGHLMCKKYLVSQWKRRKERDKFVTLILNFILMKRKLSFSLCNAYDFDDSS